MNSCLPAFAAIALVSCSATTEEAVDGDQCVAGVEALMAERDDFVERRTAELRAIFGELRDDAAVHVDLNDPAAGDNADFTEALARLRETYANITPDQIEPFANFLAELEHRENRINVAIRDCPEAAELNRKGVPQVQRNE